MSERDLSRRLKVAVNLFLRDPAVKYSLLSKIFSVVVGPLTLLCIGTFLRPEEQGVYYVFGSLLHLGAFVDLGFSKSSQQVLAHAFGPLAINQQDGFNGHIDRLTQFLVTAKTIFRIYAVLGAAAFLILGIAGHFYFVGSVGGTALNPLGPWWAMTASIGFGFGLQSIIAIADAANLVHLTNKWRLISEVTGILVFLAVLSAGGGLWASSALSWSRYILTIIPTAAALGFLPWKQILHAKGGNFSYLSDILPLQVRNMVVYGMGFFILYCYSPVTLSLRGPVAAGIIGMSIQIGNIIQNFSTVWFYARLPQMGNLAGSGSRAELGALHSKACMITAISWLCVAIPVILGAALGKKLLPELGGRYGTMTEILLIAVGTAGFSWSYVRAAYMRAYRIEPFTILSVVQAAVTLLMLLISLPLLGTTGAALTYAVTMTLGALWIEVTFRSFKKGIHKLSYLQNL